PTSGGGNALGLGIPTVVRVAWLPGAGHTAWVSDWPEAVREECEEILGALRPRCSVEIYVPNLDHAGNPIDANVIGDELRQLITGTTGGQTSYRTEGDFSPAGELGLVENTLVIKTFLPTVVTDALRVWFIDLLVSFGVSAAQSVVQVEISSRGYWIHTGLLRAVADTSNGIRPQTVLRNSRRRCSTAS
ncbi:MAG: hypothetical protein ABIU54_06170, partial [Candidatus Eisenbacteria bacterium]